jgi:hypothetical protein
MNDGEDRGETVTEISSSCSYRCGSEIKNAINPNIEEKNNIIRNGMELIKYFLSAVVM